MLLFYFVKVDFEMPVKITAFATQGREASNQRVTKYSLAYSNDGIFWNQYKNKGSSVKVGFSNAKQKRNNVYPDMSGLISLCDIL